jgi:hypothetical protein
MSETETVIDREEGIKAVIALQKLVGIDEPRERAEKNWDGFTKAEQSSTIQAFKIFVK